MLWPWRLPMRIMWGVIFDLLGVFASGGLRAGPLNNPGIVYVALWGGLARELILKPAALLALCSPRRRL